MTKIAQLYHITIKSFVGVKEVRNKKYAEFQAMHRALVREKVPVPQIPPKWPSRSTEKGKRVTGIARGLEAMLNEMMRNPDLAGRPPLCKFLQITPDIALYGFKNTTSPVATTQENHPQIQHPNGTDKEIVQTHPGMGLQSENYQQSEELSPKIHSAQHEVFQHQREHSALAQEQAITHASLYPATPTEESSFEQSAQILEQYTPVPLQQFTPGIGALPVLEQFTPIQAEVPAGLEGYIDASHLRDDSLHSNGQKFMNGASVEHVASPSAGTLPMSATSKNGITNSSRSSNKIINRERILQLNVHEGQYSGNDEQVVTAWIEELMQDKLDLPLQGSLKSGVILCKLINRIQPQTVKRINLASMPFPQRENIKAFCDAARELGVPDSENFNTDDLFENRNMKQVLICLFSLGRQCYYVPGYEGPALGRPEKAQLGAASESKFEVKGDALWGKGNSQFKAADGRQSSGHGTKGSIAHLGHSPLRP